MSPQSRALYGGVETGGTWVACLIASGPDHIVAETRFRTSAPEMTVEQIGAFFDAHPRPLAIGVGAFGPIGVDVDATNWGVLGSTPKPGWTGAAFGPGLAARTGLPIVLDTDVNAAALGEQRWGAGAGAQDVAYLTVGTGIGVGLIVAGQPLHGMIHPEAGHMRIPHDWSRDPFPGCCPYHGDCWEGLAGGPAIAARWGQPASELGAEHSAWQLEADYLALGIANVISTVSPQRFIAGGGVLGHPGLLDRVRTEVANLLAGYLTDDTLLTAMAEYLVTPGLRGRSGALGAVALAAEALAKP